METATDGRASRQAAVSAGHALLLEDDNTRPARRVVVDDHPLLRRGFAAVLSSEPDLEVVGEAEDGLEALELCREARPDLVLMDISMPNMGEIEATRGVKERCPKTLVLVLTAHEDDSLMLEALRAGAVGYLLKASSPRHLVEAVRDALGGSPRWTRGWPVGSSGTWPTQRRLSFTAMEIYRLKEGKIDEQWVNVDTLGLMQQIGAVPAP